MKTSIYLNNKQKLTTSASWRDLRARGGFSVNLRSRHSECIDQPLEVQMRLRCQRLELKSAGHGHQGSLKAVGHYDFPAHPTLVHQARRIDESSPSVVFRSFICLANFYYLSDSSRPPSAVSKENLILRPCREKPYLTGLLTQDRKKGNEKFFAWPVHKVLLQGLVKKKTSSRIEQHALL